MTETPAKVKREFDRLKKEFPFYIHLKVVNGRFYVYRGSTRWDKEAKKIRSVSEYLGKIDEKSGKFERKAVSRASEQAPSAGLQPGVAVGGGGAVPAAAPMLLAHKGNENRPILEAPVHEHELTSQDLSLLTILSMNARADLSHLGKKLLGLKPATTFYRVKQLEQRYGLRYTIEIDTQKLGLFDYMAFVKFRGTVPSISEIKEVLEKEPTVQLVMMTTGKYDMIIHFLAEGSEAVSEFMYALRTKTALSKYASIWSVTPFYNYYGFVPLRDIFFEYLQKKVWVKSRERPRPAPGELTSREFSVLRELNSKGTIELTEIDRKYGFDRGRAQYTYHALKDEKRIIKRATVTMQDMPLKYNAIIIMKVVKGDEFADSRKNLFEHLLTESGAPVNRYVLEGDIEVPDGVLFIAPIVREGALLAIEEEFKNNMRGIGLTTLVISDVIIGNLCYRRFDKAYSNQMKGLVNDYHMPAPERIDYEETGRKRSEAHRGFRGEKPDRKQHDIWE